MLVLSRKKNESIIISDNITVTVIEIRGDKVRLGIEAPKDVTVHRREVYEAIHAQDPPSPGDKPATATPAPRRSLPTPAMSVTRASPGRRRSSPTAARRPRST